MSTSLRPQVMELLVYLAKVDGRVVSNEKLLDELWPGRVVTDSTVYNCVAELRHALTVGDGFQDYIVTVPKKGYRLVAPVSGLNGPSATADPQILSRRMMIGAGSAVALILLGAYYVGTMTGIRPGADSQASVRLPLHLPDIADFRILYTWNSLALSADGRQIAYIGYDGAELHLYLKSVDAAHATKLPGTANAAVPFFSPDGNWLGYFANEKLMQVPTTGGLPIEIGFVSGPPISASWSDDGRIFFNVGYRSHLSAISSGGGQVEHPIQLSGDATTYREVHALPGGQYILYQVGAGGSIMQARQPEIWAMDLRTGEKKPIIEGGSPKYSDGRIFYLKAAASGRSLWSVAFDIDALRVSGVPVALPVGPVETMDVSRSGALVFSQPRQGQEYKLRIVDERGSSDILTDDEPLSHPRFSPNGDSLALSIGLKNQANIWLLDLSSDSSRSQLTTTTGIFPVWSHDGTKIAYYKWADGIFSQSLDSTAEPERLIPETGFVLPMDWTEYGFLYLRPEPAPTVPFRYRAADGQHHAVDSGFRVPVEATISPNRRWLAYAAIDSGVPFVYVRAFMNGARRWKIFSGRMPKWSADGRRLYFVSFDKIMSLDVSDANWGAVDNPTLEHVYSGGADLTLDAFDVSPDGKRFAIVDIDHGPWTGVTYVSNVHRLSRVLD